MPLSVLTIGAGFFAALHVEAWNRNPDTSLVGLVDLDEHKARSLAPDIEIFTDAAKALAKTTPDIVDIATPPSSHSQLIALADQLRPRAIVCQKPFCGTLRAAKAAVAATSTPLIIHENFRFQPWYRMIRNHLDAGLLGDLYQITFRLRPGDGQGPDAYLSRQPYFQTMAHFLVHETAIHWIDTFRYLMGEPKGVFADLRRLNPTIKGEDAGHIIFQFEMGQRAVFDGNRLADHAADDPRLTMGECVVEGSEGTITLDGFGQLWLRTKGASKDTKSQTDYSTDTFGGDCVYAFQKHVIDHLTKGTAIENTAEAYLRNMEIEEKIYLSSQEQRVVAL